MSSAPSRPVASVTPALHTLEGEGFEVRRPIPAQHLEALGPFIMLDQFGPTDYAPGKAKGAPEHPHYGFETLTYLLEGRGMHRDSIGHVSETGPGEAQWMRAGSGIVHDEGPVEDIRRDGGRMHGIQFWINLPQKHRRDAPDYRPITTDQIPELHRDGAKIRLLSGSLDGAVGPVVTYADPWLAHVILEKGARVRLAPPAGIELGVYTLIGNAKVGPEGRSVAEGHLAVFAKSEIGEIELAADEQGELLVLGGPRLDAPIFRYGPFVAGTKGELIEAIQRYQTGGMGRIDFSLKAPVGRQVRQQNQGVAP